MCLGRFPLWVVLLPSLFPPATAVAQEKKEVSHQERFASPQEQAQAIEREADKRLAANPQDLKALSDRGNARLKAGNLDGAIFDLKQAAALDSKSADLRANLAFAYLLKGNTGESAKAAQDALAINPKHAGAHFYLGRILLLDPNQGAEAVKHLEAALDGLPEEVDVNVALFDAYRQARDFVKAEYQLRMLHMLLPPNHPSYHYLEGMLQADLGNLDVAIEKFHKALEGDPSLIRAQQDLGMALIQRGRWPEAVEVLEKVAKSQPDSFQAAYFHALALHNAKRSDQADAEARRAISLNPNSSDAHALLGIIHAVNGDNKNAIEWLEQAVRLNPRNFDAQLYLGRARYAMQDLARSRSAFEAALALRPDDRETRFFLATTLEAMGEKEAAVAQYRSLTTQAPNDARGYVGLGAILAKYGNAQEALGALQRARELDPENYEANLTLGRVLGQSGDPERGLPFLRKAVEILPDSPEGHYQLGLALRRAGQAAQAEQEFSIVQRLNREHREAGPGMGEPEPKPPRVK
jgi:tetratricopeptide (TPR) repeat protein